MTLDEFKAECDRVADEITTRIVDLLGRAFTGDSLDPKLAWVIFETSMTSAFEKAETKVKS